jgi:hypothetical protein
MQGSFRRIARRTVTGVAFLAICAAAGLSVPRGIVLLQASETGGWTLLEASGEVLVQMPDAPDWIPAEVGIVLPADSSVRTGADGTAMLSTATLTAEGDVIRMTPSSEATLAKADPSAGILTRVLQRIGTLFFEVAHRPSGTFRVDTPYLAVVVKGTEFGVSVAASGTSVSVASGVVSVSKAEGGPAASVSAGQSASTGSDPDSAVSVSGGGTSSSTDAESEANQSESASTASVDAGSASVDSGSTDSDAGDSDAGDSDAGDSDAGDSDAGDSGASESGGTSNGGGNGQGNSDGNGNSGGNGNNGRGSDKGVTTD